MFLIIILKKEKGKTIIEHKTKTKKKQNLSFLYFPNDFFFNKNKNKYNFKDELVSGSGDGESAGDDPEVQHRRRSSGDRYSLSCTLYLIIQIIVYYHIKRRQRDSKLMMPYIHTYFLVYYNIMLSVGQRDSKMVVPYIHTHIHPSLLLYYVFS